MVSNLEPRDGFQGRTFVIVFGLLTFSFFDKNDNFY